VVRPAGTVTFLFTDIEGSTALWQEAHDAMAVALERHDLLVRGAIEAHHGQVFATGGDGFAAVFERATDAVAAAGDAQAALGVEPWPPGAPLRVRMGVHTGEAVERDGDYFGPPVNQTARLMALGHGGQVLCSATAAAVAGDLPDARDLGEHRLRGVAAPVPVFQLGDGEFPALRSAGTVPTNLPHEATELLGREVEVAELALLVGEQPLVTLAGSGGIGKTRLAVEVAATVADGFPDGAWFVDLVPVLEDDDVARVVAAAMGATGAVGSDAAALVRYLEQRQALLVLDNCEHVIEGAAALMDDLIARAPQVHTIATSRELLEVPGEVVRWVAPLSVPDGVVPVEVATDSPAVRLFEARARAVRPQFSVGEDNVEDVVDICRRLDGVPLAVELAAARVASMSPHDIRERLGERFRLLAGGRRRQDRHRTLQAAVGWSYDLLDLDAQRVFRALSVFAGSFDLDAASAVVGGDEFEVADLVSGLANRSLVVHDGGSGRYRLLETLRQYAADRLVEAGESARVQERFVTYFTDFAHREGPRLGAAAVVDAGERLRAELDNLRATAEWLAESGRLAELVGLTRDLGFFLSQDAPVTGQAWLKPIVDGDELEDAQVRYDALWLLGWQCINTGDIDRALGAVAGWRALLTESESIVEDAWAFTPELIIAAHLLDHGAIRDLSTRMSEIATASGDEFGRHMAACYALVAMDADDPAFDEALIRTIAIAEASGNPGWLGAAITCSSGPLGRGSYTDAKLDRLLDLYDSHPGFEHAGNFLSAVIAQSHALALTRRSATEATRVALAGARLSDQLGFDLQFTGCLESLMLTAAIAGQVDAAARLRAYLLTGDVMTLGKRDQIYGDTEDILAEAGVDLDARDHAIPSRRALLDLLDEIEAALDD